MTQTAKDSALVAGGRAKVATQPVTVRALRGFSYKGKAVKADTVVDVPAHTAAELVAMNKAERVQMEEVEPALDSNEMISAEGGTLTAEDGTPHDVRRRGRPPKQET